MVVKSIVIFDVYIFGLGVYDVLVQHLRITCFGRVENVLNANVVRGP